ncbi:MAG TPA: hypothetical protein DCG33_06050 [Prevotellaceae bacterium]|nr:hypothetical protein [Prevotellaceae bacterium]
MVQEEKELLLKDLNARLSYGVKVHCEWNQFQGDRISEDGELVSVNIYSGSIHFKRNSGRITEIPFNRIDGTVLPYLRPLSSITKEEEAEFEELFIGYSISQDRNCVYCSKRGDLDLGFIDWLITHHFDYRGLIPMGLALEAPENMYKVN